MTWRFWVSLVLLFVATGTAHAGQTSKSSTLRGGGVLVSVDQSSKEFVLQQGQHKQPYRFSDEVKIQDGKADVTAADLEKGIGRHITLRYTLDGEVRTADRIVLREKRGELSSSSSQK